MDFVADESIDFGIVTALRNKSYSVKSITEDFSGISDKEVLKVALQNNCLLLTEDKDFGELTFRQQLKHKGILLIRLNELPRKDRIQLVVETIEFHFAKLANSFSVLTPRGLRIKKR